MPKVETFLKSRLAGAKNVAILAIGSEFRADDSAGLLVAEKLDKCIKKPHKRIKIFIGATAPENMTGDIKRFKPSHILIVDSVDIKEKPGTIVVLTTDEIGGGVSFSTHKMPAGILASYFARSLGCDTVFIGIQPASIRFGEKLSKPVASAASLVAADIIRALKHTLK